ncbi:MAG: SDR family oxidoreductase [Wenzhouxiangellaceae bacterium]
MKILLIGANGFIGSAVLQRLVQCGHDVVCCGRQCANLPRGGRVTFQRADLNEMLAEGDWMPLSNGIDAVVNCAGILRESRSGEFDRVHFQAPLALARACVACGVDRFVQISALGHPDDGAFIASKHRFLEALLQLGLTACVLRPSVVHSLHGSYGGTSMLRAAAALPGMLVVPDEDVAKIQPILLEDLAALAERALTLPRGSRVQLSAVGPEVMRVAQYLRSIRAWLELPEPVVTWRISSRLISVVATLSDRFRAAPIGRTTWRMLRRGNVAPPGEAEAAADTLEYRPKSVSGALDNQASFVQDRWHARLYLLRPVAWLALVAIWLVSAASGFTAAPEAYQPVLGRMGIPHGFQAGLVIGTSTLNLVLGLALALRMFLRPVLWLMLLSVLGYTLAIGVLAPAFWLEPTGGLVKNLAILVLIAVTLVVENPR